MNDISLNEVAQVRNLPRRRVAISNPHVRPFNLRKSSGILTPLRPSWFFTLPHQTATRPTQLATNCSFLQEVAGICRIQFSKAVNTSSHFARPPGFECYQRSTIHSPYLLVALTRRQQTATRPSQLQQIATFCRKLQEIAGFNFVQGLTLPHHTEIADLLELRLRISFVITDSALRR
jgi:hypothetical protein